MSETGTLLQLLADEDRRRILFCLCDTESIHLPDAILPRGQTQSRQSEASHSDSPRKINSHSKDHPRQQVEIHLYHKHLPKLQETGVIEWDRDAGTVSRGPQFDGIEPVLRLLAANNGRFPDDLP